MMTLTKKYPKLAKISYQIIWPFIALALNVATSFNFKINPLFRSKYRATLLLLSYSGYIYTKRINSNFPLELFINKLSDKKNEEMLNLLFAPLSKKRQLKFCYEYCLHNKVDTFFYNYIKNKFPQQYKTLINKSKLSLSLEDQPILEDFFGNNYTNHLIQELPKCLDSRICMHYQEQVPFKEIAAQQLLEYGKTGFSINSNEIDFNTIEIIIKNYQGVHREKAQQWFLNYLLQNQKDKEEIKFWLTDTKNSDVVSYFYNQPIMLNQVYSLINNPETIKEVTFFALYYMNLKDIQKWLEINHLSVEQLFEISNISAQPQTNADYHKMFWLLQANIDEKMKKLIIKSYLKECVNNTRLLFNMNNKQMKTLINLSQKYQLMDDFITLMELLLNKKSNIAKTSNQLYIVLKDTLPLIDIKYHFQAIVATPSLIINVKDFHWYSGSAKLIKNTEKYTKTNKIDALCSLAINTTGLSDYDEIIKDYAHLFTEQLVFNHQNNLSPFDLAIEKCNTSFLRTCFNFININQLKDENFEKTIQSILSAENLKLFFRISLLNKITKEINWYNYLINTNSSLYPFYNQKAIANEHNYFDNLLIKTEENLLNLIPPKKRNKI